MPPRRLLWLPLAAGLAASLSAQQPSATPSREARWREDLAALGRELPARQLDFAKLYPGFAGQLAAIERSLPAASDADVALGLMRLLASANVAHTTMSFPQGAHAFRRLPLQLYWYDDGLAVTAASEPYRAALGLHVSRVGSLTPEALETALTPYIAHENREWLKQQSPSFMVVHEILRAAGQVAADGRVPVTLRRPDGSTFMLLVEAGPWQNGPPLVSATTALNIPTALFRKNPGRFYWHEFVPERRGLYLQYSRCANDPALPFADFARQVFAEVDVRPVDRLVVDLRFNAGGDSRVIAPLVEGLRARPALRTPGRLVALIGRATFSSGLMAAVNFRDDLKAVLVGEPVGEKLNSYGEVKTFTLPHSQLTIQYSTKYFRLARNGDRDTVVPDVRVARTLADALAGRDPALDAAWALHR
jgi:hypothetical protein